MRTWDLNELEHSILAKSKETDKILLESKPMERLVRRRPRDPEEQKILDIICINKWKAAEANGQIKYRSAVEWDYEY